MRVSALMKDGREVSPHVLHLDDDSQDHALRHSDGLRPLGLGNGPSRLVKRKKKNLLRCHPADDVRVKEGSAQNVDSP